jgi:hypothetical protein
MAWLGSALVDKPAKGSALTPAVPKNKAEMATKPTEESRENLVRTASAYRDDTFLSSKPNFPSPPSPIFSQIPNPQTPNSSNPIFKPLGPSPTSPKKIHLLELSRKCLPKP